MVVEVILLAIMVTSVAIKWITTLSIRDRHAKLADVNEDYWQVRSRHKALVTDVSMAEHEIDRLKRKIRAAEHRLSKLTRQQSALQQEASSRAGIEAEKARLADEIRKKRES